MVVYYDQQQMDSSPTKKGQVKIRATCMEVSPMKIEVATNESRHMEAHCNFTHKMIQARKIRFHQQQSWNFS